MARKTKDEQIAAQVEKLMSDTRMNWARGPRTMSFIAVATAVASLATPLAFLTGTVAGVSVAALMFLGYFILRGATRGIAEVPAKFLDERELALRNSIYVKSYQTLAGMLGLLTVGAFAYSIFSDATGTDIAITLNYDQIQAFVWLFLGPITIIPTVSVALSKGHK